MKSVMKTGWILAGALGLALCGCTAPPAAQQDPMVEMPQVHYSNYYLQTWTRIQPPSAPRVGSGQLDVSIPIRNLTNDWLIIQYQYTFLNHKMPVEGPSGWTDLRVPKKGIAYIRFTSMSAAVDDFDVEIRQPKP